MWIMNCEICVTITCELWRPRVVMWIMNCDVNYRLWYELWTVWQSPVNYEGHGWWCEFWIMMWIVNCDNHLWVVKAESVDVNYELWCELKIVMWIVWKITCELWRPRVVMCGLRVIGTRLREVAVQVTHSSVLLHLERKDFQVILKDFQRWSRKRVIHKGSIKKGHFIEGWIKWQCRSPIARCCCTWKEKTFKLS